MNTTIHENAYLLRYNYVILINIYNNDLREKDQTKRPAHFVVGIIITLMHFYIHQLCYHIF